MGKNLNGFHSIRDQIKSTIAISNTQIKLKNKIQLFKSAWQLKLIKSTNNRKHSHYFKVKIKENI